GTGFLTARALGSPPRFWALAPATNTKETNTARSAVHTRDIRRDLRNARGSAGQFIRLQRELWRPGRTTCCIAGGMNRHARLSLLTVLIGSVTGACATFGNQSAPQASAPDSRGSVMARATLWRPTTISAMDLKTGPSA